jgi:hypothetical protein
MTDRLAPPPAFIQKWAAVQSLLLIVSPGNLHQPLMNHSSLARSTPMGRENPLSPLISKFDTLGLPEQTPFPQITSLRRFRRQACGSTLVDVSPGWTKHKAQGRGSRK